MMWMTMRRWHEKLCSSLFVEDIYANVRFIFLLQSHGLVYVIFSLYCFQVEFFLSLFVQVD